MIHYITTNGIGNAWVAAELEDMEKRGIACKLHSMRPPHQNFFDTEWADRVNRATNLLYPLSPARLGTSLLVAPLLFRRRFVKGLANALFGRRESARVRLAGIAHFVVACDWARELRHEEVSLIHSQWIQSGGTIGWCAAALLDKPFSFTGHAVDLFRERAALKDKIEAADFIVSISRFHSDFYVQEGATPDKLQIVYCGIELDQYPFRARTPRDPKRILSFGRLVEKKGLHVLLDACALLKQRGVVFECEVAGNGPEEEALRAQVKRLGLEEVVNLTGEQLLQSEIDAWLQTGHVFAQPCVWSTDNDVDGIPRSLMEAMASGLPSVSTRIAGIPDLVVNDESGLLVEPNDAVGLADAIQRLLADDELADRIAQGGRAHVERLFNLETCLAPLAARFRGYLEQLVPSVVPERVTAT